MSLLKSPAPRRSAAFLTSTVALAAVSLSSDALACGGFFCSSAAPVDQAAERIIFAQDEEGRITQIVEVLYEGPAEKFSWILPVPGVPEPGVSSSQAFDRLQNATAPVYSLPTANSCPSDWDDFNYATGGSSAAGSGGTEGGPPPPTVTVLDSGSVGPFNYETIAVDAADQDPADVAVRWLEDNEYDVGPNGADVLRPYLQNGLNLIAFRLTKGQSAGAIRPIVLEYDARAMAIPILPTAVAAKDDMPILVWTLGAHRAVPTNYFDLELNDLLINWFNFRPTYDAVISAAADEAGGQGFVTELAGPSQAYETALRPTDSDVERALGTQYPELPQAMSVIIAQLGNYDGFREAAADHIVLRDGVTLDDYLSCSYCYFAGGTAQSGTVLDPALEDDPIYTTDMDAFRTALLDDVLQPFFDLADLMLENPYITRLYTTMSAEEMTKDPTFEFNPDAEHVSNVHAAEYTRDCEEGGWRAELPSGEVVFGQTVGVWPYSLSDAQFPVNVRIRQFSTSGPAETLVDNGTMIDDMHDEEPASDPPTPGLMMPEDEDVGGSNGGASSGANSSRAGGGCAYDQESVPEPWAWLGLGLLGALTLRSRREVRGQ